MDIETVDPAQTFIETARAAEAARGVLVSRLAAIKVEKKETVSRLTAEARAIRLLLGRTRAAKTAGPKKARAPRKPKAEASNAA